MNGLARNQISCGYLPLLQLCSLTLSINYFVTQPCPYNTPINSIQLHLAVARGKATAPLATTLDQVRLRDPLEKRVPPPNGGHGSWFPAVCRGAPIPIVMLLHTYGSTAMPCVCVDNLYHYHFIEEPRKRLPHPHPWHTNVSQKSFPTLDEHTRRQRRAPCHSVDTIL